LILGRSPIAQAQTEAEIAALNKRLDDSTSQFKESKEKAKASALVGFDRLAVQARNGKHPAAIKANKVAEINAAKKEFDTSGTFPADDEFVPLQLKYYQDINKSYRSLTKLHDQLLEITLKSTDEKFRESIEEKRRMLDAEFPGPGSFAAGSLWRGSVSLTTGGTEKLNLQIEKLTGGVFRARVISKRSSANHPEYLADGTLEGLAIKFKLAKVVQGTTLAASFSGILTGDRLIGILEQASNKGKRSGGLVVLTPGK
jgi:hypothetical protein